MTTLGGFNPLPFSYTQDAYLQSTTPSWNPGNSQATTGGSLPPAGSMSPRGSLESSTSAPPVNIQYLEQQIEMLMRLLRISNDHSLQRHYVSYRESTTSKNPLPPSAFYGSPTPYPFNFYFGNGSDMEDGGNASTFNGTSASASWGERERLLRLVWPLLPLALCILISVTGNLLVCLAVWRDKKLQSMTNYFLFSLAIADLGVAAFVMPLALVNNFAGSWILGPIMCNLWTTMDVTFCTSSILHLCTIQLDRYMAIRVPVRYGEMNRSKKWATIKMFIVWFLSSCVGGTLFTLSLITQANSYRRFEDVYICAIFSHHIMLYGSMAAFYIPFLTMMILYTLTVYALRQRSLKNKKNAPKVANGGLASGPNGPSAARTKLYIALRTKKATKSSSNKNTNVDATGDEIELCPPETPTTMNRGEYSGYNGTTTVNCCTSMTVAPSMGPSMAAAALRSKKNNLNASSSAGSATLGASRSMAGNSATTAVAALTTVHKKKRDQKENERRAQLILLIVFVSFVLLWFPFFAINIATPICKSCVDKYIDPKWIEFTTWMGYISSMLNPIIYTIFNKLFRDAFLDIILCRNPNQRRINRARMGGNR